VASFFRSQSLFVMRWCLPRLNVGLVLVALVGGVSLLSPACQNDNEEDLLRDAPCDTTNVTYNTHIKPILTQNCTRCHTGPTAEAGYDLSVYANVVQLQAQSPGLLQGVIDHESGFQAMPRSAQKLIRCDRDRIRAWIARGMPE